MCYFGIQDNSGGLELFYAQAFLDKITRTHTAKKMALIKNGIKLNQT